MTVARRLAVAAFLLSAASALAQPQPAPVASPAGLPPLLFSGASAHRGLQLLQSPRCYGPTVMFVVQVLVQPFALV